VRCIVEKLLKGVIWLGNFLCVSLLVLAPVKVNLWYIHYKCQNPIVDLQLCIIAALGDSTRPHRFAVICLDIQAEISYYQSRKWEFQGNNSLNEQVEVL
jgi:hypothetical protein